MDYSRLDEEYVRTAAARDRLETKCRHYKERLREWSAYTKEWHLRQGKGGLRDSSSRNGTEAPYAKDESTRALSAPAPFSLSSKAVLQPIPRATSLQLSLGTGEQRQESYETGNPLATEPRRVHIGNNFGPEANSSTGASADSEDALRSMDKLLGMTLGSSRVMGSIKAAEDDSPILVSARPVKRKRGRQTSPTDPVLKIRQNDNERLGTAEKPVRIKSDQSSSSPLAASRFRAFDDHDSMDLDEVGQRTFTPMKRQRMDTERLRFSGLRPLSLTRGSAFPTDEQTSNNAKSGEEASSDDDMHNKDINLSFTPDEGSCKIAGEEYAAKLWKEQHARNSAVLQNDAEDGADPPEHVRSNGRRTRADRHNQRLHERQTKTKLKQHTTSDVASNPFRTPMGAVYRDQSGNTAAIGLPTPVTTIRRPDLVLNPLGEKAEHKSHSVLQPTDPNNQILPRTSESMNKRIPPPSRRDRGAAHIHVLSEDGDIKDKSPARDENRAPRAPGADRRLEGLLAEPSSDKPLLPWETPSMQKKTHSRKAELSSPDIRNTAAGPSKPRATPAQNPMNASTTTTPGNKTATLIHRQGLSTKPTPSRSTTPSGPASVSPRKVPSSPEKGPIRFRPLETLHRKHFKLNPAHNSGYNYAYREVIRKRNERKCLPGCTRPDCCGETIRKMLAIGGPLPSNHTNLFSSSPEDPKSDGAEDHRLVKEYMGDNYPQWRKMNQKEKDEEWMMAQKWNFGKTFGRHKDNGRQATPPGYWRVDMASTQERAQDEEEAERMEREKVEGMWREAMRKGGAFLFADE